jgi:integrase/recombinase XerD
LIDSAIYQLKQEGIMTTLREKMKTEMVLAGLSPETQKQYLCAVKRLYKYYDRSPAKLTEEEIKMYLLEVLSQKRLAPSSYNVMIYGLKFFFEKVLHRTIIAERLSTTKEPQKLPDILSRLEVEKIIKATSNLKHRTILMIIYSAGLRISEVVALMVKDIDSERGVIHIRQGKGGKDRYVMLSPVMLNALRTYWKYCRASDAKHSAKKEDDFIFVNALGEALSTACISQIYKQAKQLAGIDKRGGPHSLRHAFAIHALELGVPLYTIKQLLGHSSVISTTRYLRMTAELLKKAVSPIEQLNL